MPEQNWTCQYVLEEPSLDLRVTWDFNHPAQVFKMSDGAFVMQLPIFAPMGLPSPNAMRDMLSEIDWPAVLEASGHGA